MDKEEPLYYRVCDKCQKSLCRKCKEDKQKIDGTETRTITFYNKAQSGTVPLIEWCRLHPHMINIMYCQRCEENVCPKCIEDNHPRHLLLQIQNKGEEETDINVKVASVATEETQIKLPDGVNGSHISCVGSDKAWISGWSTLMLTDLQGRTLDEQTAVSGGEGYHSMSSQGQLFLADQHKNCIHKLAVNNKLQVYIRTGVRQPISVHSSASKGDILVGMWRDEQDYVSWSTKRHLLDKNKVTQYKRAIVTRYSRDGHERHRIEYDQQGHSLYHKPGYIIENRINGDICVSDRTAVVVVNSLGDYKFSFYGQKGVPFFPSGICTDVLGHILVYAAHKVHMIDQHGNFLSVLITLPYGFTVQGICVDSKHKLWCGHRNMVRVYNYLQDE